MNRGQFSLQDGGGFPTRCAIVSLTLRDGSFSGVRLAGERGFL